jgi:ParB/RepB/Spo0J family partition protein
MKIATTLTTLPVDRIEGDPRNPNRCSPEVMAKLKNNIRKTGYYPPLIVRPHPDKAEYYRVIDGHHRLQVLRTLGYEAVECQVLVLSEVQAQLLLATLNRLRGEDNLRLRAELLDDLEKQIAIEDLVQFVPENEAQIQDLLKLLTLEEAAMEARFKEVLEKEAAEQPVILNFVVAAADAAIINEAIRAKLPSGSSDPAQGLLCLCKATMEEKTSGEVK